MTVECIPAVMLSASAADCEVEKFAESPSDVKFENDSGSERSCSPKSESSGCSSAGLSAASSDVEDEAECDEVVDSLANMNLSVTPRVIPGQALRDMAAVQRDALEQHEKRKCVPPPPGFEKLYGGNVTTEHEVTAASVNDQQESVLVSYADGSTSLAATITAEPLCLHNITVSAVKDACHVFIKQMQNPTHSGLAPLEEAMMEMYENAEVAQQELLRPIATGSLLAVKSDAKWYRCQVVAFNESSDTCDVKFVDHGGYTTVPVADLRGLPTEFIRLPFQAIEVYLAHISPATDEIIIDIVSDILFREEVSIQVVGQSEDGLPVVQAFFYVNEFIHLLTQEVVDDCFSVLKEEFPDYTPQPIVSSTHNNTEEISSDAVCSSDAVTECDAECAAALSDWASAVDEGVWSYADSDASRSSTVHTPSVNSETEGESSPAPCVPAVSPLPAPIAAAPIMYPISALPHTMQPVSGGDINSEMYVPMQPVLTYCVQDPNTGLLYYVPVLAAPACVPVPEEHCCYTPYAPDPAIIEDQSPELVQETNKPCIEKPVEEWSQEDYENYYNQQE